MMTIMIVTTVRDCGPGRKRRKKRKPGRKRKKEKKMKKEGYDGEVDGEVDEDSVEGMRGQQDESDPVSETAPTTSASTFERQTSLTKRTVLDDSDEENEDDPAKHQV